MTSLQDADQRQQATDPTRSYIVQAPAGSGKTELLTQRYLRLLSIVNAPEQIVALTFTKKAANEMRERIVMALHQAAMNTPVTSPHQQQTRDYAQAALSRNQRLDWQLRQQPNRLRIMTIDALCQRISQAIPLHAEHIAFPNISDLPEKHTLQAATACLNHAIAEPTMQPSIRVLLRHVDNRQDALLALFVDLLLKRDQWIQPLFQAKMQDKSTLESALLWIEQHELNRFKQAIPIPFRDTLIQLARTAAMIENNPDSPRYPLRNWVTLTQLNGELTMSLAQLLLTSQNSLRKCFDHHVGIKRGECDDREYDALKEQSKGLLSQLENTPGFLDALIRVKHLPAPVYQSEQWETLQALFVILPFLMAHLTIVFAEHNEVDFTAISQQALDALGHEDDPTDLALHLDNAIHHLLVDEFQDTSIQQFQLISKLVSGWHAEDGKTLFVVGDPMQSIYRFRAAEVGLFLRAKQHGIGNVPLIPLQLRCNFRSTATIVDWVNDQFHRIFPKIDDIESGAVSFHPSTPTRPPVNESHIQAMAFESRDDEAAYLIGLIREELETHPNDNIAILVRSRSQLSALVTHLRANQIPFQGIEMDLLTDLPHLRDVWSLTQALLMPANRLAWLAVLRSPWCGLSLPDLHQIATTNKQLAIPVLLNQSDVLSRLSEEGQQRAQFIRNVMNHALATRHQQSLVDWIMNTLNTLHLEQVLSPSAQEDLEQYWRLLGRFEQDGQLPDMQAFHKALKKLYSQQVTPSRLQIMTIHKSKGLEFDCVILPGLSKKPPALDKPLIRWLELPRPQQTPLLLVSPIKAAHHERCLLYDYLGKLDTEKQDYELQRLLYVAATRAKKRLYLTDDQAKGASASFRALLHHPFTSMSQSSDGQITTEFHGPTLQRLPLAFYQQEPKLPCTGYNTTSFSSAESLPRILGIVLHEALQWIGTHHPQSISQVPFTYLSRQLRYHGLTGTTLNQATHQLTTQLHAFFKCPIGQWIIKRHQHEQNEYELILHDHGEAATRIIDRTFEENGIRWIIDFKTGHEHPDARAKHRQQLLEYAALFSKRSPLPIHCGIYYLVNNHWITWAYEPLCL